MNDYISQAEQMFFKHKITEKPPLHFFSAHLHNTYELLYFIEGDATHVIEDRKYKLKKGDLIIIPPFKHHFIQIDSSARYERYNILFDAVKHKVESVSLIPEDVDVINIENNEIAKDIFRKCAFYFENSPEGIFTNLMSSLLSELFYSLYLFPQTLTPKSSPVPPIVSKALEYINENLFTIKDIKELAVHLFVSESYLFRLFKRELHQTPKQHICEKRLLAAQKMISSGEKPSKAALSCGFTDYTTFYRNYTTFFGHSPSQREQIVKS